MSAGIAPLPWIKSFPCACTNSGTADNVTVLPAARQQSTASVVATVDGRLVENISAAMPAQLICRPSCLQVPSLAPLFIRVVNNVNKRTEVKPSFWDAFKPEGSSESHPYRQKVGVAQVALRPDARLADAKVSLQSAASEIHLSCACEMKLACWHPLPWRCSSARHGSGYLCKLTEMACCQAASLPTHSAFDFRPFLTACASCKTQVPRVSLK